jgi:hypothetical protein
MHGSELLERDRCVHGAAAAGRSWRASGRAGRAIGRSWRASDVIAVHRRLLSALALALALAGCEAHEPVSVPVAWTYAPPALAWPIGEPTARIGRGQAPQVVHRTGISGQPGRALTLPTVWQVPGDGAARAIVAGRDGAQGAVELVDIDRGAVVWRDTASCAAPVVGVTAAGAVCGDAHGVRVLGFDGKLRWRGDDAFVALDGERIVLAPAGGGVTVHDTANGTDAHGDLPKGVDAAHVIAACGERARELFATTEDGKLVRVADDAKGNPAIAWTTPVGGVFAIDACRGDNVVVTASTEGGTALVALARATGKVAARVDGVRGYWPACSDRDRLEIATATGVASWPRDLAGEPTAVALPGLAQLLAQRGDRRLVRATPTTAALLDRSGLRAYVPLAELGAALGDHHVLASSWLASPGNSVRRFAIPEPWGRPLRIPSTHGRGVGVPAELRDLPPLASLEHAREILGPPLSRLAAIALDPERPEVLYALADRAIARADLGTRAWTWTRDDTCGATAFALAVGRDVVACAASGPPASVRAIGKDGSPLWRWETANVDAVEAAADVVLAFDADRLTVLASEDGRVLATLAADDGSAVRAAALDVAGTPVLVTFERGQLIARLPRAAMLPAWSLAVDGVVARLSPAGDGVLVELEDGDAYRVDARTGKAVALPGLGLTWRAAGDLVLGGAPGEPTPPAVMPVPPRVIAKPRPLHESPENPAPIGTPWPVPPQLGPEAWQLTLYELSGALRARNDYSVDGAVLGAPRGPLGSPIVVPFGRRDEALVIDAARGDPVRRVHLAVGESGAWFATVVDGKPVAGVVLANPLRLVLF